MVLSGADPKHTFEKLCDPADLPADFLRAVRNIRSDGTSIKINLALDRLPVTVGQTASGPQSYHYGVFEIGPTLDVLDLQQAAARAGKPARQVPTSRCASPRCTIRPSRPREARRHHRCDVAALHAGRRRMGLDQGEGRRSGPGRAGRVLPRSLVVCAAPAGALATRPRADPRADRRPCASRRDGAGPALHEPAGPRPCRLPDPDRRSVPVRGGDPPGWRGQRRQRTQLRHRGTARPTRRPSTAGYPSETESDHDERLVARREHLPAGTEEQGVVRPDGCGRCCTDARPRRGAVRRGVQAGLAHRRRRRQRLRRPCLCLGRDPVRGDTGVRHRRRSRRRSASTAWRSPTTSRATSRSSSPRSWWRSLHRGSPG